MVLARTRPGAVAAGAFRVDTEVFHMVVRGSASIGGAEQLAGDMRVQRPGSPLDTVVAGPEGVDELIVFGDRRGATPEFLGDTVGWPSVVVALRAELAQELAA